jgi:hypothetical protein
MIIVSYEEFIKLPSGTMYCETEPCIFGDIRVKGDTINDRKDWYYQSFQDNLDYDNDFAESYDKCLVEEVSLDFDTLQRDGMFDYDRAFAIYSKEDIRQFIKALEKLL